METIMHQIKHNPDLFNKRWVGYFDLLGTKKLINSENHVKVFSVYCKAIEEAKNRIGNLEWIEQTWFSDTFIFYTDDFAISSFNQLDHLSYWFLYFLIDKHIPARGAISFGEFYADRENNLFFGKSLIEAYEYGEAQNWIGFLLCPSAKNVLKKQGLFSDKSFPYIDTEIPYNKREDKLNNRLPACILGSRNVTNGVNYSLENLHLMRDRAEGKYRIKYDNTTVVSG